MINLFSKVNRDTAGATIVASTTVLDMVKPALIEGVFHDLKEKLTEELFKQLYPLVEEKLKEEIPGIVKQLSEEIIVDIRRRAFGIQKGTYLFEGGKK